MVHDDSERLTSPASLLKGLWQTRVIALVQYLEIIELWDGAVTVARQCMSDASSALNDFGNDSILYFWWNLSNYMRLGYRLVGSS